MAPSEETLKQKAVRIYAEKAEAHEPGPVEQFFDTAQMKIASFLTLLVGLSIVPYHMFNAEKGHGAPEISLIAFSVMLVLLGSAGSNPKATKLAGATAKQLLPGKWSGNGS